MTVVLPIGFGVGVAAFVVSDVVSDVVSEVASSAVVSSEVVSSEVVSSVVSDVVSCELSDVSDVTGSVIVVVVAEDVSLPGIRPVPLHAAIESIMPASINTAIILLLIFLTPVGLIKALILVKAVVRQMHHRHINCTGRRHLLSTPIIVLTRSVY